MGQSWVYPIPDRYGNGTINLNPSDIGYGYESMLEIRGKELGRKYPYPPRPIVMSKMDPINLILNRSIGLKKI